MGKPKAKQPPSPYMDGKHNCALFKRKGNTWKWELGGAIQRYPKVGEMVVVAYSNKRFAHTDVIVDLVNIDTSEPDAIEVVFQDKDQVWKLIFPAHCNDIAEIKRSLKEQV